MAEMVMVEMPDFEILWICSECGETFKATKKFEKNNRCPSCDNEITVWLDLYEE